MEVGTDEHHMVQDMVKNCSAICYQMMDLEDTVLSEMSQPQKHTLCRTHSQEVPSTVRSQRQVGGYQGWGRELVLNEESFSIGKRNVLRGCGDGCTATRV
jgi:hypothetical protein